MRVCVTGGSGFIGSFFHDVLPAAGHEIVVLDPRAPAWDLGGSRFVHGDVRNEAELAEAMRGCDAVLHLAAAHHDFGIAQDTYFSVNEGGARNICRVADTVGIRSICFYSSVAVFGTAAEPVTEQSIPQPFSDYGKSKLAAEGVFRAWAGQGGRTCLVIRPTVTFGPRNFGNMYSMMKQIHRRRFLPVGKGENVKSLAYVENLVEATMYLWNLGGAPRIGPGGAPQPGGGFEVYNYIDKPDLTSREIVAACYEAMGRGNPRLRLPLWIAVAMGLPFDLAIKLTGRNLPISTARIRKLCTQTKFEADKMIQAGFKPRFALREGILRMGQWFLSDGQYMRPTGPVSNE